MSEFGKHFEKVLGKIFFLLIFIFSNHQLNAAPTSESKIPGGFAFQGYLNGLADGSYPMKFSIRRTNCETPAICPPFDESQANVAVNAGIFSVILETVTNGLFHGPVSVAGPLNVLVDIEVTIPNSSPATFTDIPISSVPSAHVAGMAMDTKKLGGYPIVLPGGVPPANNSLLTFDANSLTWGVSSPSVGAVTLGGALGGTSSAATITAGAVGNAELANNAVSSAQIQDATITAADIGPGQVDTSELADNSVTNAKIPDGGISYGKINASGINGGMFLGTTALGVLSWRPAGDLSNGMNTGVVTLGATADLYLKSNSAISLWTGATPSQRMEIDTNGNVGIGAAANPSYLFSLTSASTTRMLIQGSTQADLKFVSGGGFNLLTHDSSGLKISSNNGAAYFKIANNGFVGINTGIQPSNALEVSGKIVTTNLQVTGGAPAEGKLLKSDATGNASWVDPATLPSQGLRMKIFDTPGSSSFLIPVGVSSVIVEVIGGGGGGGSSGATAATYFGGGGGGGNGGTYVKAVIQISNPSSNVNFINYTIGNGGAASSSCPNTNGSMGNSGSDTTVTLDSKTITAQGGRAGYSGFNENSSSPASPPSTSIVAGGIVDYFILPGKYGMIGGIGGTNSLNPGFGGKGGDGAGPYGGNGGSTAFVSWPATGFGSGGGGGTGAPPTSPCNYGQAGRSGLVVIQY